LNLGERSRAGIAVSVVSEILAELNGRSGRPLSESSSVTPQAIDA
jgi:xanthine/CO dehydrogenase XdhC/CoxF family maturation factor